MVYKEVVDCGFSVIEAPVIPKAPRSIRRNRRKKLVEEEHPCSFELLAAVAGKILEESEGSASCNAAVEDKAKLHERKDELPRDDNAFRSESFDRGSCAESAFTPENFIKERNCLANLKGLPEPGTHPTSSRINAPNKVDTNNTGKRTCQLSVTEPLNRIADDGPEVLSRDKKYEDPNGSCVNTNSLVTSESSENPLYRKLIPNAYVQKHWNNVKLGLRDDDENFIGCNEFSTRIRPFRSQSRLGQRRMRKTVTHRYWKAALKRKSYDLCTASEGTEAFYGYKKCVYPRERWQQAPIKKRRLFDQRLSAAYDCGGDTTSNSISSIPGKAADGIPACKISSSKPKEHHVTLRIKSFKVPELYLEMPESATVGSLKKTVLEAFNAILGGGTRVGVFLQGRKIRDDNRTLQQAGISQCTSLERLGFALEPSPTHISSANSEAFPVTSVCDADHNIPRSLVNAVVGASGISNGMVEPQTVTKSDSTDGKELISIPNAEAPYDISILGEASQTMALVPVPPMQMEMITEVPLNQKPKCTNVSQRRTRRPFSVTEVEALVEAVEKLGTGRWRDVKMRSFENADHRTYVDLKDKWKTLVHTASIPPQQRRGEPVPQELLDRVLSAHSYWSQHPSKQHKKAHNITPLTIVDSNEEDRLPTAVA